MSKKSKFDYFEAFVHQVECACEGSTKLVAILEDFHPDQQDWVEKKLADVHEVENRADGITRDIVTHLAVEFMPPIDREDVSELAQSFDDVMDGIDDIVQHLYMYNITDKNDAAIAMAKNLDDATHALLEAAKAFNEFKKLKKLEKVLGEVHAKESEGDDLYMKAKRDLFINHADAPAVYLLGWNGMFSHMEDTCDACERVASIMSTVALKNT